MPLRVPIDFPLVSLQWLILLPIADLTVNSPTLFQPHPQMPEEPIESACVSRRPRGDGRRRPSEPGGTRRTSPGTEGGAGEVTKSGRRAAGETKDSSPAAERTGASGRDSDPPPDLRSRLSPEPTNGRPRRPGPESRLAPPSILPAIKNVCLLTRVRGQHSPVPAEAPVASASSPPTSENHRDEEAAETSLHHRPPPGDSEPLGLSG